MEEFTTTFGAVAGAGAAAMVFYAFYRVGRWLRDAIDEAAEASKRERYLKRRARVAQQQREVAVQEALQALDNDDVLGLYVQLQSTPYVLGHTKKARKARAERSKIQSRLRRLVPSAAAREALYKGWVGEAPYPKN